MPFYFRLRLLYNPPRPCTKAHSPEDSRDPLHDETRTEAQHEKIPSADGAAGARGAHHPGTHMDDGTDTDERHTRRGRVRAARREEDSAHHNSPRRHATGRLLLDARQEEPGSHLLPRSRERLHRRGDEADGSVAGQALQGAPLAHGAKFSGRPAVPCPRRGGVQHAHHQWLQALPHLLACARSRDVGTRQSRRDDTGAGRGRRCRKA